MNCYRLSPSLPESPTDPWTEAGDESQRGQQDRERPKKESEERFPVKVWMCAHLSLHPAEAASPLKCPEVYYAKIFIKNIIMLMMMTIVVVVVVMVVGLSPVQ